MQKLNQRVETPGGLLLSCSYFILAIIILRIQFAAVPVIAQTAGEVKKPVNETVSGHFPKICYGRYRYENQNIRNGITHFIHWGTLIRHGTCPEHHAVYGSGPTIQSNNPKHPLLQIVCCPLPSRDILLEQEVSYAAEKCPNGSLITGYKADCSEMAESGKRKQAGECKKVFRCTQINQTRYSLGPVGPAAYWGPSLRIGEFEDLEIAARDLPPAVRAGLQRVDRTNWEIQGCVGWPMGSLLVGREGRRCKDMRYQSLRFRGIGTDPKAGTAVKMFPECHYVSDLFGESPVCHTQPLVLER